MRGTSAFVVAAWLAAMPAGGVLAHGTGARIVASTATVVELYYTDGEPMAYAEAKVYSPDMPDVPFVNGRADRLGRVAFAADREGVWRIEARDNDGHGVRTDVTITGNAAIPRRDFGASPWLLWVSLFVNVFALASLMEARRDRRARIAPVRSMEGVST